MILILLFVAMAGSGIWLFFRPVESQPVQEPKAGEVWSLGKVRRGGPWPTSNLRYCVKILDVKEGWVRYMRGSENGNFSSDERKPMQIFTTLYEYNEIYSIPEEEK